MSRCFICDTELKEINKSEEHIIPNALGGKLVLKDFLCKDCNNNYFRDIDTVIAKDCETFANFLNIQRDRGEPQEITATSGDREYVVKPGGKPEYSKPTVEQKKEGDKVQIKVEARNVAEAKEILEGLKRKYPIMDLKDALSRVEDKVSYLDDYLHFNCSFKGGWESFRAMAKMVLWTLKYRTPDFSIKTLKIFPFLKGDQREYKESFYFYPEVDLIQKPDGQIYHSILIKSYPQEKMLIGFIELYSVVSAVMILSDNFDQEYESHYVFDVLERKEVATPLINYPSLNKNMLNDLFARTPDYIEPLKSKCAKLMDFVTEKQRKDHLDELIGKALKNSLMKYPGAVVTEQMMNEFYEALMKELTPLIQHNLKQRNLNPIELKKGQDE